MGEKRRGLFRRFKEAMFSASPEEILDSIIDNVLFPTIQDFMADTLYTIVDVAIYHRSGGRRGSGRRGYRRGSDRGIFDYSAASTDFTRGRDRRERTSYKNSSRYKFEEIIFDTMMDANDCYADIVEYLEEYPDITVYHFLEIASDYVSDEIRGEIKPDSQDQEYGWTKLDNVPISHEGGFYYLELPAPKPIKR